MQLKNTLGLKNSFLVVLLLFQPIWQKWQPWKIRISKHRKFVFALASATKQNFGLIFVKIMVLL